VCQLALGNKAAAKEIIRSVERVKDSLPPAALEIYGKVDLELNSSAGK